jgi:hypothetical protein
MMESNAFKGISFKAKTNKWEASLEVKEGKKRRKLSFGVYHDTPEAAAHHRDM